MIKLENTEVVGWEAAIRGMRNPMNSWEKSDSSICAYSRHVPHCKDCGHADSCNLEEDMYKNYIVGPNDHDLMMRLAKGGSVHAKYRRMIVVYVDITAPLYWWKEFDTYKVGTVANSCSTMHKIHEKEFTEKDFSLEHFIVGYEHDCLIREDEWGRPTNSRDILIDTIDMLNTARDLYLKTKDKKYWWQMIQLLPSSYNQKRTVMLNYEVLAGIYPMRKEHKLDEWREFCQWIETLPYSELITVKPEKELSMTPNECREKLGLEPINEVSAVEYENIYGQLVPKKDYSNYDNAIFNSECN